MPKPKSNGLPTIDDSELDAIVGGTAHLPKNFQGNQGPTIPTPGTGRELNAFLPKNFRGTPDTRPSIGGPPGGISKGFI